ncbi:MAG: cytochrome c maturation protein CcmE [bacterium]
MKLKYVVGFAVIAACVVVGVYMLKTSMTPYLPFKEAMAANGREVQIIGSIVKGKIGVDAKTGLRRFMLKDQAGTELEVETRENLPSNFEHAKSVVAVGSYKNGVFVASKILAKCPSKYEKKADGASPESRSAQ